MADKNDDIEEPAEEERVEEVNDMKMSRTEEPETDVNFEKIRDLFVFDGYGNKIRFGDIYKKQKTIIIFVRHFLDFITKDYVEDISMVPLEYLQEADVRLVVIGPAPYKFIPDFKKETGLQYTLYCDPEREIYTALHLGTDYTPVDLNKSKHVKQNVFMGMLRSTWKAMKVQEWQGDVKQQGGAFIFGPGEVVHFSHIDKDQADHVPMNTILGKAGIQPVSFPKDPRVQDL